jgi:hypothetical protein
MRQALAGNLAGIEIGDGSTIGVGGLGIATVASGGNMISQGCVAGGVRGTAGEVVVNDGTVQVGTTLEVATGGTIRNDTSYAGNYAPWPSVRRHGGPDPRRADRVVRRHPGGTLVGRGGSGRLIIENHGSVLIGVDATEAGCPTAPRCSPGAPASLR